MSTEGAALSHLRDMYYILTHDLAAAQLDDLADANWNAQAKPPEKATDAEITAAKVDAYPIALVAAGPVSPIISRVAPTAVLFAKAVEAAQNLTDSSVFSTFILIVLVYILMIVISIIMLIMIFMILKKVYHDQHAEFQLLVPAIGYIILGWMGGIAFMYTWLLLLNAKRAEMQHNSQILKVGYWHVHNVVGGAYAIRFSAAVQAGTLHDLVNQPFTASGSTLVPGNDCSDDKQDYDPQPCGNQINVCATTIPSLEKVIADSCRDEIFGVLRLLNTLKTGGVDSYDRSAMWATISAGMEAIRATIEVSANADTTMPFVSSKDGAGTPGTPAFPGVSTEYIMPNGGTKTLTADPTAAILAVGVQSTIPADVIASLSPIMQSKGVNELSKVLADEPGTPSTADQGLRKVLAPFFERMTAQILPLLTVLPNKLNINDYRDTLEASLSKYYGTQYPKIQYELLSVITHVQKAQDAAAPSAASAYVDAPTMAARINALGPAAWMDLVGTIDTTRQAVQSFQTRFKLPANQPSPTIAIMSMLTLVLTMMGFVVLMMFISHILYRRFSLTVEPQNGARYILVAACVYALGVVIAKSMVDRLGFRASHNWDALRKNGQTLGFSLGATELAGTKIKTETSSVPPSDAQAYIDAARSAVQAYDDCNAVTNGASVMPFPTMELVIYVTVVVAVVAGVLFGISELNPSEKLSNIRTLLRIRERVQNGESPAGIAEQLECCSPRQSVWEIMMWLSVVILFLMNIFVMTSVTKTNNTYAQSLLSQQTCV